MGPVIAIPRNGAVSTRNMFTRLNYPLTSYSNDEANITLAGVKLTSSVLALVEPVLDTTQTTYKAKLSQGGSEGLDRVVYCLFVKQADNTLRLRAQRVATEPGEDGLFSVAIPNIAGSNYVLYAYGVRDNTDAARAAFGNMQTPTAEAVAKLIVSRTLTNADVTLTETKGVEGVAPAGA